MSSMTIEVWLYGPLARYAGDNVQSSAARVDVRMPAGSCMRDLLRRLSLPTEQRGITFIDGKLSALPGKQPDLEYCCTTVCESRSFISRACGRSSTGTVPPRRTNRREQFGRIEPLFLRSACHPTCATVGGRG